MFDLKNYVIHRYDVCRGGPVGIAIHYGLDGWESDPGVGEIFRTRPDRPWDDGAFVICVVTGCVLVMMARSLFVW